MDDERFESAWSAHGPAVLRYCTYSTGSSQEGEDIAAEALPTETEAWTRPDSWEYVRRLATNTGSSRGNPMTAMSPRL